MSTDVAPPAVGPFGRIDSFGLGYCWLEEGDGCQGCWLVAVAVVAASTAAGSTAAQQVGSITAGQQAVAGVVAAAVALVALVVPVVVVVGQQVGLVL
mmetsp:Transcript_17969/g.27050  ORF Transcript_17969/g.27050 Transcript_17969/m.27050 type:complete len:97 (+) Transcript_17969:122-412(+)